MNNKIRKIFLETPEWNDDKPEDQKPQDYDWTDAARKTREAELKHYKKKPSVANGGYVYSGYEDNYGGDISFVVARVENSNEPLIGEMVIEKVDNFRYPAIMTVHILSKHRRLGIGYSLYDYAIRNYGGIISDKTLSGFDGKGSFQLWQALSKDVRYSCYLLHIENDKVIKTEPVKEITRDMMGSNKVRFMATKKISK